MTTLGRAGWWAVVIAAAAGLLLSVVVLAGDGRPQVDEVRGEAAVASPAPTPATPARPSPGAVGREVAALDGPSARPTRPPSRLEVPSLGLDAAVRPVGVTSDRQMRLPADPRVVGWYRFGPAPGNGGSVVLAGHVDSRRFGVGPLVALQSIEVGARVEVSSGTTTRTYLVDSIERFDQQSLPVAVFGRTGPERLRLVTCTGPYLPEAGGYQQNLVVTAVPAAR